MKIIYQTSPIELYCVKADKFPEGIQAAFDELKKIANGKLQYPLYGISYPDRNNQIQYFAGSTVQFQPNQHHHTLPAGHYFTVPIAGYRAQMNRIGETFEQLTHRDDIAPDGCCIEYYENDHELTCMIRKA